MHYDVLIHTIQGKVWAWSCQRWTQQYLMSHECKNPCGPSHLGRAANQSLRMVYDIMLRPFGEKKNLHIFWKDNNKASVYRCLGTTDSMLKVGLPTSELPTTIFASGYWLFSWSNSSRVTGLCHSTDSPLKYRDFASKAGESCNLKQLVFLVYTKCT